MENTDPIEEQQDDQAPGLYLTNSLLDRTVGLATLGFPLMILCAVLGIITGLYFLRNLYTKLTEFQGEFYLLEGDNGVWALTMLLQSGLIYLFTRATLQGLKGWKLLAKCKEDDQALLEGFEKIGHMFRWAALLMLVYLGGTLAIHFLSR